ncbi:MAG: peptidase [Candidatus Saccharibacteria bacterium]|nr:peptidase [Candidatus Saccharibacteria bacterium]
MVKRFLKLLGIVLFLLVIGIGVRTFIIRHDKKELVPVTPKASTAPVFDKKQFSTSDPASIWMVVNKHRPINPVSYVPADLVIPNVPLRVPGNDSMQVRKVTATALEMMFAAAKADGLNLMLSSGYRSYQYQVGLYNGYVASSSVAEADKTSARPGYSEHQSGLAADIEPASEKCDVDVCFAQLPEGVWLAANAYKYGFIIRYTSDKVPVTGYTYEPWHVRYVGTALSNEMHKEKIETLEEFFSLGAAPSYSS